MTESTAADSPSFFAKAFGFVARVVKHFLRNKGLLLASAVGYNALISIIPLCLVILTILSNVLEPRRIAKIVNSELKFLFFDQSLSVQKTIRSFAEGSGLIGGVGFVFLLFFSSIAFRMLEDAMAVIFREHERHNYSRHPVMSFTIAFLFMMAIGFAIFFLTVFSMILNTFSGINYEIFGHFIFSPSDTVHHLLRVGGFIGMFLLLTCLYRIMPTIHVRWRVALALGFSSAVAWEIVRFFLEWYFQNISLVNVIYGSLGTVVLILVSFEVAAVIILLGAQVISELELSYQEGIPWYEAPMRKGRLTADFSAIQKQNLSKKKTTRSIRAINEKDE